VKYTIIDRKIILAPDYLTKETEETKFVQQQTITGKVTDSQTGEAMPGVNIQAKGTILGTITDGEGKYSLSLTDRNATLVFSFIGYVTQEIALEGRTLLDVTLSSEVRGLEEVVVIGYGTQKKVNLTGSVTTIKTENLKKVPVPDLAQAMMGASPGVYIKNVSGQPGDLTATKFNIRGWGDPLIIIDGMTSDIESFNQLPADQIESFSVLKDAAAAAVYGARAGNGVILVQTKRGRTGLEVTLTSNFSLQYISNPPEFVNSLQMAQMENVARQNMGREPKWTQEQLQKFEDGDDPQYPNTSWMDETFRKFAPQMQHGINIQGGSDRIKYFVSGNYFYQEALPRANETFLNRYNIRSNIDIAITDKLNLGVDLNTTRHDYITPANETEYFYGARKRQRGLMIFVYRCAAYWPAEWPDPTKPVRRSPYMYSLTENVGYRHEEIQNTNAKLSLSYDLPYNIKAIANLYIDKNNYNQKFKINSVPYYDYNWTTDTYIVENLTAPYSSLEELGRKENSITSNISLNWNKQFGDHNISALAVYEYLSNDYNQFAAERIRYDLDIDYIDLGPSLDQVTSGIGGYDGRMGLISRINYNFKERYYVELNGRYDASPRFPKETRWGFFPSVSVGWRISEENFLNNNLPFITNLKLRASHGKLGNDAIGQYQYLATYSLSGNYLFDSANNTEVTGIKADALPNPNITWETMRTSNLGLDFDLWNNKLEGSIDVFYRLRSDVLGRRAAVIPNIVGATMPMVNYAEYDNRGFEVSLNTNNNLGKFFYSIGGNVAWNRGKTVFVDQSEFGNAENERVSNQIDQWTDVWWGVMTDGLFETKEEIENWAIQDGRNNATIYPGDVKKIDLNNDGIIDNYDRVIIGRGNGLPMITYGINMNVSWKNIALEMLWQGAGLNNINLRTNGDFCPFFGNNTPFKSWYTTTFTPENPWMPANTSNTTAKWPIYGDESWGSRASYSFSEFWLGKGDYLRLKNLRLSYSLSERLTNRLRLSDWTVYISGYNLLTFSHFKGFIDPEINTQSDAQYAFAYHPPVGTYNIGMIIKF